HAAVEGAQHLRVRDVALLLQPLEDRRTFPGIEIDDRLSAFGQNPRQVLDDAAASDVGDGVYFYSAAQCLDGLDVNLGGDQQGLAQGAVAKGRFQVGTADLHHLADQGVAVRVGAGGVQGDQPVAGFDPPDLDDLVLFYHANREARQVVVVLLIHARHLGGLAADQ